MMRLYIEDDGWDHTDGFLTSNESVVGLYLEPIVKRSEGGIATNGAAIECELVGMWDEGDLSGGCNFGQWSIFVSIVGGDSLFRFGGVCVAIGGFVILSIFRLSLCFHGSTGRSIVCCCPSSFLT